MLTVRWPGRWRLATAAGDSSCPPAMVPKRPWPAGSRYALRAPCWKCARRWRRARNCHWPSPNPAAKQHCPTSPTCAARRRRGEHWRSRRRAPITCYWSARPVAARPCSPRACAASCHRPARPRHWKPPASPPPAVAAWTWRVGDSARFAHRTTPPAQLHWSAAVPTRAPAKSRWPIMGCCSSMSCRNGAGTLWKSCVSRWSRAACAFRGRHGTATFPPASNWLPP